MPVGVIVNSLAVVVGGLIGAVIGNKIPDRISKALTNMFGLSALLLGISLIIQIRSLSAVILAVIIGALIGEVLNLEQSLTAGVHKLESKLPVSGLSQEKMDHMVSMIVLFCFSGTGVFGAMNSAISGDQSILFAKSILDFFTALIFGSTVGYMISLIAIPQTCVGLLLFYIAEPVMPLINEIMLSDFKACGGVITFAVGLKISGLKSYQVINMLPALLLVMPFSYLWNLIPF